MSSKILSIFTLSPTTSSFLFRPSWLWAAGTLLSLAGGLFRLSAFRELGRHFTFELALLKDHQLVTSGPFSVVRHPGYTGYMMLCLGSALANTAPGSWVREFLINGALRDGFASGPSWMVGARMLGVGITLFHVSTSVLMLRRTRLEDEMLKREFGKKWEEWARRTPFRLIPGVY
jgi:protein-S-isoprenylcysteine O-methyltransferase Ste14